MSFPSRLACCFPGLPMHAVINFHCCPLRYHLSCLQKVLTQLYLSASLSLVSSQLSVCSLCSFSPNIKLFLFQLYFSSTLVKSGPFSSIQTEELASVKVFLSLPHRFSQQRSHLCELHSRTLQLGKSPDCMKLPFLVIHYTISFSCPLSKSMHNSLIIKI